jgi:hypothetical protein
MSVESISSLVQNLSGQAFGQTQDTQGATNASPTAPAANAVLAEDTFTPSTQDGSAQTTAQDAGIFQLAPGTLTALNPNVPFAPTTQFTYQNGAPAHAAPVGIAKAGATQSSDTTKTGVSANASQQTADTPAAQAASSAAASANIQLQIQSLNAALPTLGLTNTEINQIDRIASLIQNFNPAAYASMVSQFEALGQITVSPNPANLSVIPGTGAATSIETSTNGGALQAQGIPPTPTGAPKPAGDSAATSGGTQGTTANNVQTTGPGLQIS